MGLGSAYGYLLFWGKAGIQGAVWAVLGILTALLLGKRPVAREAPLLIPAFSALWVAATGLVFQMAGVYTPLRIYLLRVALAGTSAWFFRSWKGKLSRQRVPVDLIQLRLEVMAEVLGKTRSLLLETEDTPVDEEALLVRARERACGGCPNRRTCRGPDT